MSQARRLTSSNKWIVPLKTRRNNMHCRNFKPSKKGEGEIGCLFVIVIIAAVIGFMGSMLEKHTKVLHEEYKLSNVVDVGTKERYCHFKGEAIYKKETKDTIYSVPWFQTNSCPTRVFVIDNKITDFK